MRAAKPIALLVAIVGLIATPPRPAAAVESDPAVDASLGRAALMAVDVFPVRVGSFLRLTVGSVLMVPATLFSALAYPFQRDPAVFDENAELYVLEPFDYTFRRPLGQDFGG